MVEDSRPKEPNAEYMGVKFEALEGTDALGNRLVIHEYPNRNTPYVENMGRKTRKLTLKAVCSGDDWESKRDAIITAIENKKPATLIHPSYGKIENMACEECNISTSYVNGKGKCDIDLTFIDAGKDQFPAAKVNTQDLVNIKAEASKSIIQQAFGLAYDVARLPQTAADFISNQIQSLTGYTPYQFLSGADAIRSFLATDFIGNALDMSNGVSSYLGSFRVAFFDSLDEAGTNNSNHGTFNTTTPRRALGLLGIISKSAIVHHEKNTIKPVTENKKKQLAQSKLVTALIVSHCAIEKAQCSTYIEYANLTDAKTVWEEVLTGLDDAISYAADNQLDVFYRELKNVKSAYQLDIQVRSPGLTMLSYLNITVPVSSLVLAYNLYEDATRADEIVTRNNIAHPGFITGHKIEVLSQ